MLRKNQKGQALFEFVVFLPFLLALYSVILTISNAFNASINQQKITRSYFFYTKQNDSNIPAPNRAGSDALTNFRFFSMVITGWANEFEGDFPVAPCFEIKLPMGDIEEDECKKAITEDKTRFIRVGTVFGICGASYMRPSDTNVFMAPFSGPDQVDPSAISSCALQ